MHESRQEGPCPAGGLHSDDPPERVFLPRPHATAVRSVHSAVDALLDLLQEELIPSGEVLELAEHIGTLVTKINAAHTLSIGQAKASGMWAILGYASSTAWLRFTHLMDSRRARSLERTAAWLEANPRTRAAYIDGRLSAEHVSAIRRVIASCPRRAAAYPKFEEALLQVAANSNPECTARVLRAWADALDPTSANEESTDHYERRSLYLSPLGEGWDLRGWLPSAIGAELAGLLNEAMAQRRRDSDDDALDPPPARRLDALMDLARAAAVAGKPDGCGPFLSSGARHRARVVVTIPIQRLMENGGPSCAHAGIGACEGEASGDPGCAGGYRVSGEASSSATGLLPNPTDCAPSWACTNGPGEGFLAMSEALRLACDGEVQRLVLGPQSQPLDIGRSTRVVPDHIRTALHHRDGGCVVPGCRRPPGWCEAHHVQHWSDGGLTAVQNLALICSRHHHELHNGSWRITMTNGVPQVERRAG